MFSLFLNINFWSALSGLIGTTLIFLFGLPPKVDPEGHTYLVLEQDNKNEKRRAKKYKWLSYLGLLLIGLSFLLQIINLIVKV